MTYANFPAWVVNQHHALTLGNQSVFNDASTAHQAEREYAVNEGFWVDSDAIDRPAAIANGEEDFTVGVQVRHDNICKSWVSICDARPSQ